VDVSRDAAKERSKREEADRGREHPARSEAIGHPAADWNEDGEAQRVAGEHRFHAERRDLQGLRNNRYGRVQNRRVEGFHKKRDRDQPWEKLLACGGRRLRKGVDRTGSEKGWLILSILERRHWIAMPAESERS
jgi:hypothetical protein